MKKLLWTLLFACCTILFGFEFTVSAQEEQPAPDIQNTEETSKHNNTAQPPPQQEDSTPDMNLETDPDQPTVTETQESIPEPVIEPSAPVEEQPELKVNASENGHITIMVDGEPDSVATDQEAAVARVSDGQWFYMGFEIPGLQRRNTLYIGEIYLYAHVSGQTFRGSFAGQTDYSGTLRDGISVMVDRGLFGLASISLEMSYYNQNYGWVYEKTINEDYSDSSFDMYILNSGLADARHISQLLVDDADPNNTRIQAITTSQAQAGVNLFHHIAVYMRFPDADYQTETRFYQLNEDGSRQQLGETVYTVQHSQRSGLVEATIPLGFFDSLLPGRLFGVETNVIASDGSSVTMSYQTYQHNNLFVIDHDNDPQEEQTLINVRIDKRDEQGKPVIGAALEIIKGTDPGGNEIVYSWISNGEVQEILLPPGDYVLVERKAPDGWLSAKPVQFSLVDGQANIRGYNYVSYSRFFRDEKDITYYQFVLTKEASQTEEIAYCINYRKPGPDAVDYLSGEYMYYRESEFTPAIAENHFYNKDLSAQELIDALKRVIYNGHLYNASGIQEKYQLSDGEFHGITQNAIHHFTDRVEFKNVDFKTADIYEAYMELISASLDPPENWVLTLYIPTHEGHQTLISAMFKQANLSVDLEMIDPLDHQEEKPEGPTEEETEEEKEKPQEQQKEELVLAKGVQTGVWISFYPSLWMMGIGLFGMIKSRH